MFTVNENPWRTVPAGSWVDAPFPKPQDTYEALVTELIQLVYNSLYNILAQDAEFRGSALPAGEHGRAARPTGVYEFSTLNPRRPVFPAPEDKHVCGKLALLCPIPGQLITDALAKALDARRNDSNASVPFSDDAAQRCLLVAQNWLRETYCSDDVIVESSCNNCGKVIKCFNFRIRCAECTDYDLCEKCFCAGVESEKHSRLHRYLPLGPQNYILFTDQWTASEDSILLEAVARYGFGNWNEVAEWVAVVTPTDKVPAKDKESCKNRYFEFHVANKHAYSQPLWPVQNLRNKPLYDGSLGFTQALVQHIGPAIPPSSAAGGNAVDYTPLFDARGIDLISSSADRLVRSKKATAADPETGTLPIANIDLAPLDCSEQYDAFLQVFLQQEAALAEAERQVAEGCEISKAGMQDGEDAFETPEKECTVYYQATKPPGALPPRVSISGYLPNRGDFDAEWDNNAELLVCDLEIKEYESPMEKQYKLAALESYNVTLDDRWLRKRLYLDRCIYDPKHGKATSAKPLWESLRPLWRYFYLNYCDYPGALFNKSRKYYEAAAGVSQQDLDELSEAILDDKALIDRMDLLTMWKSHHLSTLQECLEKGGSCSTAIERRSLQGVFWSLASLVLTSDQPQTQHQWLLTSLAPEVVQQVQDQLQALPAAASYKQLANLAPLVDVIVAPAPATVAAPPAIPKKRRIMHEEEEEGEIA